MEATSGGASSRPLPWYPSDWKLPKLQESEIIGEEEEGEEKLPGEQEVTAVDMAEMVPESLKQRIYPIMRTANAMEKFNRRVAFLCAYLPVLFCFLFSFFLRCLRLWVLFFFRVPSCVGTCMNEYIITFLLALKRKIKKTYAAMFSIIIPRAVRDL